MNLCAEGWENRFEYIWWVLSFGDIVRWSDFHGSWEVLKLHHCFMILYSAFLRISYPSLMIRDQQWAAFLLSASNISFKITTKMSDIWKRKKHVPEKTNISVSKFYNALFFLFFWNLPVVISLSQPQGSLPFTLRAKPNSSPQHLRCLATITWYWILSHNSTVRVFRTSQINYSRSDFPRWNRKSFSCTQTSKTPETVISSRVQSFTGISELYRK